MCSDRAVTGAVERLATDSVPALLVRTTAIDRPDDLLALLPDDRPTAWVRDGDGLVGWGCAARLDTSGAARFEAAGQWWSRLAAAARVSDNVGRPGTGLVSFGSFAFSDNPGASVLVVPRVVVGRRAGRAWLTAIDPMPAEGSGRDPGGRQGGQGPTPAARVPQVVAMADGTPREEWEAMVAGAVARIRSGRLSKVVLARDVQATLAEPLDVRTPIQRLAARYPNCWTFSVDGLFGATPELLVQREGERVASRVLAGTLRRTGDDTNDLALASTLAASAKDQEEHRYAVTSVADTLRGHCKSLQASQQPFVLELPNVLHLATDITGVLNGADSSLALAGALHPSAAVGGTPTPDAVALIEQIERLDRGRYAGPVGWMDASGDGEWGIALRSATHRGTQVTLYAGCGIVSGSDPAAEYAESEAKLVPVTEALQG